MDVVMSDGRQWYNLSVYQGNSSRILDQSTGVCELLGPSGVAEESIRKTNPVVV